MATPTLVRSMSHRRRLGSGFKPTDISGCTLWLEARFLTGYADGASVDRWADLSGLGRDAVQATGSKQPTFKTNILNGYPVIRFDGTDDVLNTASAAFVGSDGTWTAFAVVTSTASAIKLIVNGDNGTTIRVAQFLRYLDGTSAQSIAFDTAHNAYTDSVSAWSGWDVLEAVRDGTSVETFINGTGNGSTATANTPDGTSTVVNIGDFSLGSFCLPGDLAAVLLYNRALTTTERLTIRTYCNARYLVF